MTTLAETQGMSSASRSSRRELCTVCRRDRCRRAHSHVHRPGVQTSMSALTLGLRSRMRPSGLIPEAVTLVRLADIACRRRIRIAKAISLPMARQSATILDTKAGTQATRANPIARRAVVGVFPRRPRAEAATVVARAVTQAATTRHHANGPHHTPRHERGHGRPRRSLPSAMPSLQTSRTWSTSFWAWRGPRRRRKLCRANQQ